MTFLPILFFNLTSNFLMYSKLIILLGNIDQQLIKGCDEFIQLYKLAYYIMSLKSNLKT